MIINELILENIGAYYGVHEIDLSVEEGKNVVLIGGKNGAGKTTFLNSIRLGIFGAFGFGYRNSKKYDKKVLESINSRITKAETGKASIVVSFDEVEKFQKNTFNFKRSWTIEKGKLVESFLIKKNGIELSKEEIENQFSRLKESFSPKMFDFCLFDGEEIQKVIVNDELPMYIKELSSSLFNLDLFKNLEIDINNFLQKQIDDKQLNQEEKLLFEEKKEYQKLIHDLEEKTQYLQETIDSKENVEWEIESTKTEFEVHGGVTNETISSLMSEELVIEAKRKENSDRIKSFISVYLPFYMNKDLFEKAVSQMECEEQHTFYNTLCKKINDLDVSSVDGKVAKEELKRNSIDIILKELKPEKEIEVIHGLSSLQSGQITHLFSHISSIRDNKYTDLLAENKKKLSEAQEVRKKISLNQNNNVFEKMVSKIEELSSKNTELEHAIFESEEELESLLEAKMKMIKSIEAREQFIMNENRTKNSFGIAQKILSVSSEFQLIQIKKKIRQVEYHASKMLKKLMKKDGYITSIKINPTNFEVTLFDEENFEVEKKTLSAGEKEMLMLSVVWAIFNCSGRRVPFIFDTLLGRLDQDHRQKVLSEFIPKCGKQVIILSTNSEISDTKNGSFEQIISKNYLLEFESESQSTRIKEGYFSS